MPIHLPLLGMVKKLTIVNTFVLHTLHRNITSSAVITYKRGKHTAWRKNFIWRKKNKTACIRVKPLFFRLSYKLDGIKFN